MDHIIAIVVTVGVAAFLLFSTVMGTGTGTIQGQLGALTTDAVTNLGNLTN